jgi:hypothetical protein
VEKMNGKNNSKLIEVALEYGCKTAKDFAAFIKKYNPNVETTSTGRNIVQLSLFSHA